MTQLVLASASPARLQTLRNAGVDPVVIVSGVDESVLDGLPPTELALQLAELKCAAVAERDELPAGALVLGCDSVLDLDGEPLGKPGDPEEAVRRWQAMRGRTGVLRTGHCLRDTATGKVAAATASTTVHFAEVTDEEVASIRWYADNYVGYRLDYMPRPRSRRKTPKRDSPRNTRNTRNTRTKRGRGR